MKTLSKILTSFVIGVGIGNLIECLLTLYFGEFVMGTPDFLTAHPSLVFVKLVQTGIYGGFGLVSLVGQELFSKKENSLFKATTLHLLSIFAYFAFAGFYLRWFTDFSVFFISCASFLLIYFIIWTLIYLAEKRKFEEINRQLQKKQEGV